MVLISQELLGRIRDVAEQYAENERRRLSRADDAAWERIRVTDPARYAARGKKILLKVYHDVAGCIQNYTLDDIPEAIEYVKLCTAKYGHDSNYEYRIYGFDGERVEISIDWYARVTRK